MAWASEFLTIAKWALQTEDLRHRYIYSSTASALKSTPGIDVALEVTVVLAVYQAALGKGYVAGKSVDYERAYPGVKGQNPPRADLAFKDKGKGKNWAYLEAKRYGPTGKSAVEADIGKLKSIKHRSQRWLFVYRVRRTDRKVADLATILKRNFSNDLEVHGSETFAAVPKGRKKEGICDLCLARVK